MLFAENGTFLNLQHHEDNGVNTTEKESVLSTKSLKIKLKSHMVDGMTI